MKTARLATTSFRCCDSDWTLGAADQEALGRGRALALAMEKRLNAFDPGSSVSQLNREGRTADALVAAVVRRALEMRHRTGGAFDIGHGRLEHAIKGYIRGGPKPDMAAPAAALVVVDGDHVQADAPVDLNGIAKGFMADRVWESLAAAGPAFVDAGGDIAHPLLPIDIEDPRGGVVATLDTTWNVATSGNARRRRGDIDHIYDPRDGHVGARHDQVTVLSRRDCAEADALATTLAAVPSDEALALCARLPDVQAMFLRGRQVWWTPGFEAHVRA